MIAPRHLRQLALVAAFAAPLATNAQASADAPKPPASPGDPVPTDRDPPPYAKHRLVYANTLGLRLNPIGIEDRFSIGYRYRLYRDRDPLFRESNVHIAFTPVLNPAVAKLGATFELQPLSILKVRVNYGLLTYLGSFGNVQSYDSPYADHSDTARSAGKEKGTNYATTGGQGELGVLAQIKIGLIAVRNEITFYRNDVSLKGDDDLYYDMRVDTMVPAKGYFFTNDSDVAWVSDFGLVVGARASVINSFYTKSVYAPGDDATKNPNGPIVRTGPLAAYTFFDKTGERFSKPTAIVISQWYLQQRFRTGADTNQAMPYLIFAFQFAGDLMPWKFPRSGAPPLPGPVGPPREAPAH